MTDLFRLESGFANTANSPQRNWHPDPAYLLSRGVNNMTAAAFITTPRCTKRRQTSAPQSDVAPFWLPPNSVVNGPAIVFAVDAAPSPTALQLSASSLLRPITGHKVSAAVSIATLLLGFIVGRISKRGRRAERLLSNADDVSTGSSEAALILEEKRTEAESGFEGVTPVWLNFALTRMWGLFQKNTKRLVGETLQPILDETELPEFVQNITVSKFVPGRQSPLIQSVRRLPSRSLAEVQYAMRGLFSSTSVTEFQVAVQLGGRNFSFPVTMENLDIDAKIWVSYALAPYEPFLTGVQYGLLESPKVTFEMTIAKVLPITAVPLLRKLFFRIITQEVPKDFMLPNTQFMDFTPPPIQGARTRPRSFEGELTAELSMDQLRDLYPEQWALFDALDLDGNGSLSRQEISAGLKDWGYTAEDAAVSYDILDLDSSGKVSFQEFVQSWPQLEASFVPSRYKGELVGLLRNAKDIKTGWIAPSDPVATLRLNGQEMTTKKDSQTSVVGNRGEPIWMQTFDFKCSDPQKEQLEIVVAEGSFLGGGRELGRATVPLSGYAQRRNQKIKVNLEPQGSVWLDLSYAEFV